MERTKEGFRCSRCGYLLEEETAPRKDSFSKRKPLDQVIILESGQDSYVKVLRECPKCGNEEAFRWFSGIDGEHAGVRRERTVEHFRCTKCHHSWAESH